MTWQAITSRSSWRRWQHKMQLNLQSWSPHLVNRISPGRWRGLLQLMFVHLWSFGRWTEVLCHLSCALIGVVNGIVVGICGLRDSSHTRAIILQHVPSWWSMPITGGNSLLAGFYSSMNIAVADKLRCRWTMMSL